MCIDTCIVRGFSCDGRTANPRGDGGWVGENCFQYTHPFSTPCNHGGCHYFWKIDAPPPAIDSYHSYSSLSRDPLPTHAFFSPYPTESTQQKLFMNGKMSWWRFKDNLPGRVSSFFVSAFGLYPTNNRAAELRTYVRIWARTYTWYISAVDNMRGVVCIPHVLSLFTV